MSWSYAYAFRAGEGHDRCDDVCVCETLGDYIIAAVADGAGSAEKAHFGASLACQAFIEIGVQLFCSALEPACLIEAIASRLPAGQTDAYSCTLVGAVAGPKGAIIVQVGDGAAVVRLDGGSHREPVAGRGVRRVSEIAAKRSTTTYELAMWPEETEFLNHTFFVTAPDAAEHLHVRRIDAPLREFALFTDGLQHLILNRKDRVPHQPFFETVFKPLADAPDHDVKTSWWLERLLGSDNVTKLTDDDTSIVLARRLG